MLSTELDEHVQRALNCLPKDFRYTVILADIEGKSYEEISQAMDCSLGTVRSRLHRGRKQLKAKLDSITMEARENGSEIFGAVQVSPSRVMPRL